MNTVSLSLFVKFASYRVKIIIIIIYLFNVNVFLA